MLGWQVYATSLTVIAHLLLPVHGVERKTGKPFSDLRIST